MSAPIEPRVRFQAQYFKADRKEWRDAGYHERFPIDTHEHLRGDYFAPLKKRIVKQTTTFEVVKEMEPKS